jgi:hypothetical protein
MTRLANPGQSRKIPEERIGVLGPQQNARIFQTCTALRTRPALPNTRR